MKNIVLVGYQGVGKTFYGRKLAQELDMRFVDTDEEMEKRFQGAVRSLYEKFGENTFRREEKRIIEELQGIENTVIATGGGVGEIEGIIRLLQGLGNVVYIYNNLEVLRKRWEKEGCFYAGIAVEEKFSRRCKLYEECCNNKVEGTWDQILLVGSLR